METLQFPKSLTEAVKMFSDPDTAWSFIKELRWPGEVTCPFCNSEKVTFMESRKSWTCKGCRKQFSVKTKTVFQGSPLPLDKWLTGFWLIMNCKNGISSYELASTLGISQHSAWFMGHRLRHAMKTGSFTMMTGAVEVDETHIGGLAKNMHLDKRDEMRTRGFPKIKVVGFKERGGEVRTVIVPNIKAETLQPLVKEHVAEGAKLYTDQAHAYEGLSETFTHKTVNHKMGIYGTDLHGQTGACEITTNGIENYWSGLKRTYKGTYIHYSAAHAANYLAEQEFRYNNRDANASERFAMLAASVAGKRLTYNELVESGLTTLTPR